MLLNKIITLANKQTRLRFLTMERSLRDSGCKLPVWVIPYDDKKFELPSNSFWWEIPEIIEWLTKHKCHPMMRKYQCLTESNYQYVDSDVVFLSNPQDTLRHLSGFISSCSHWHNPHHTYTKDSLEFLKQKSTLWQKFVFNAGQFACDQSIYTVETLKAKAESEVFKYTCLLFPYHDQPGLNLLVNSSPIKISNLTLPPYNMESTWAGDYNDENYEAKWILRNKPFIIHWAGCNMNSGRPIDKLFYQYLTREEKEAWIAEIISKGKVKTSVPQMGISLWRKLKRMYYILKE